MQKDSGVFQIYSKTCYNTFDILSCFQTNNQENRKDEDKNKEDRDTENENNNENTHREKITMKDCTSNSEKNVNISDKTAMKSEDDTAKSDASNNIERLKDKHRSKSCDIL